MSNFEKFARKIIEKHGCTFIKMVSECRVLWKNKCGYESIDDIFVLNNMDDGAWEFWSNYDPA